jgi:hypothetical protein
MAKLGDTDCAPNVSMLSRLLLLGISIRKQFNSSFDPMLFGLESLFTGLIYFISVSGD